MTQVEETLAWEAEQRPRASAAAVTAGVFTIAGSLLFLTALRDYPSEDDGFVSITESISSRLGGQATDEPSMLAAQLAERQDHAPALWASAILTSLGVALAMLALLYVYRATKARAPDTTGRPPHIAAVIALVFFPLGQMLSEGALLLGSEADRAEEARDVFAGGAALLGETLAFFGTFATGLAFMLVSLNAMRVGLLTRFMGILGVIVGVLAVVQLDVPQIIRAAWLVFLGVILAGRLRERPPAWETGRAMPWPSNQQIREARMQAAAGTNVPPSEPDAPVPPAEVPAAAQKRKRKKRR